MGSCLKLSNNLILSWGHHDCKHHLIWRKHQQSNLKTPWIQWLRPSASTVRGMSSLPGWGTKILHATGWPKQTNKNPHLQRLLSVNPDHDESDSQALPSVTILHREHGPLNRGEREEGWRISDFKLLWSYYKEWITLEIMLWIHYKEIILQCT